MLRKAFTDDLPSITVACFTESLLPSILHTKDRIHYVLRALSSASSIRSSRGRFLLLSWSLLLLPCFAAIPPPSTHFSQACKHLGGSGLFFGLHLHWRLLSPAFVQITVAKGGCYVYRYTCEVPHMKSKKDLIELGNSGYYPGM